MKNNKHRSIQSTVHPTERPDFNTWALWLKNQLLNKK